MKFCGKTRILFLVALLFATNTFSQQNKKDSLPRPMGYVNDFEHIFSKQQRKYLDSIIGAFERRTTIQIALVTIDTSMVTKKDFDNYVLRIANKWGVGQKEKNNGVTIGISKNYRVMRIENGYGIEAIMTDSDTKKIMDNSFIPYFKKGLYFEGTREGLRAIMKKLE